TTLTCTTTTSLTLAAAQTYYLMLYAVSSAAPTPQPTALVTPSVPGTFSVIASSIGGTVTLPTTSSISASSLVVPAASSGLGTVITGAAGSTAVDGLPTPSGLPAGSSAIYYGSLRPAASISFNGPASLSLTFGSAPASGQ